MQKCTNFAPLDRLRKVEASCSSSQFSALDNFVSVTSIYFFVLLLLLHFNFPPQICEIDGDDDIS